MTAGFTFNGESPIPTTGRAPSFTELKYFREFNVGENRTTGNTGILNVTIPLSCH